MRRSLFRHGVFPFSRSGSLLAYKEKSTAPAQCQDQDCAQDDDQHLLALGGRFGGISGFGFRRQNSSLVTETAQALFAAPGRSKAQIKSGKPTTNREY
jgi:hypothetical protein